VKDKHFHKMFDKAKKAGRRVRISRMGTGGPSDR
jgi:hypothetical protein